MPRPRMSLKILCQTAGAAGFLSLSAGCLPPPAVVTFQSTPTPVLLSKVDRIGGTPQAQTPPPIASFRGNVRSEIIIKNTTVTNTTTTTDEKKEGYSTGEKKEGYSTGEKKEGYSTGEKKEGYSTGEKKEGYSTGSNNNDAANAAAKGYSTGQAPKYCAPPRTYATEPPKVRQNEYVYGAGAFFEQGPNLLTFYSLQALYSDGARARNPNPPNPKDVDIYIKSLRVRSIFYSNTDSETSQTDPETDNKGQTSQTTTTKETRTIYKANGARVKAVITPKR
jgi:hypothetical protein